MSLKAKDMYLGITTVNMKNVTYVNYPHNILKNSHSNFLKHNLVINPAIHVAVHLDILELPYAVTKTGV